ncbi:hypothetical protein niasHT_027721 [Heterodera trifolii]|uniref:VQ domain-containing protein n=1 Tax=Heterodera trifolii TaxID=157864 RepID=A0ABD2KBQ2_9BILA
MTKPQQFTVIFPFLQLCAFFSIICEAVKDNDKNQNNQTAPQSTNSAPPTIIYQNEPPVIHVGQQEFSKIVQEITGNAATSTSNKKGGGKADGPLSASLSVFKRPAPKKLIVFKPQPNKPQQPAAAGPSSTSSSSTHFQRGESKFQMLDGVEKRLLLPPKWLDEMNDNNTN